MATRLERLWVLLDSGSTPGTRKAAAIQIGEIQKLHPHELKNLLKKVGTYLTSKSWETRIAAGQAVEAIASNVKQWEPTFHPKQEPSPDVEWEGQDSPKEFELLSFDSFDFKKVLDHGTPLLSSTGDEFQGLESDPEFQNATPQERLAVQHKQLEQRLGLSAQGKVFAVGMEQLFDDNDLVTHVVPSVGTGQENQKGNVRELTALQLSGLSAREINQAKRKARLLARRASVETDPKGRSECDSPPSKKLKTSSVVVEQGTDSDKILIDQVTDMDSIFDESEEWPFGWFCEEMFHNLFNPAWEVRHGAATALREIIKLHGKTAGLTSHTPPPAVGDNETMNQRWLADAAVRILCVLSLDRFADFVSDQVVAPVRATCAQALGVVAHLMTEKSITQIAKVLLLLASVSQWEVRHASLMGIQLLLATRTDFCSVLLPSLFPSILRGLQDTDDDVRAVAASSLLPVSTQLTTLLPNEVPELLHILWDSLLDLDDLSASTNSIMELMGNLLSSDQSSLAFSAGGSGAHSCTTDLQNLIPRLWPFLGHNISSVRKCSLQALTMLLSLDKPSNTNTTVDGCDVGCAAGIEGVNCSGGAGVNAERDKSWLQGLLQPLLCQIFQRFLLEGDAENRELLFTVWSGILTRSSSAILHSAVFSLMWSWLCLLVVPASSPVDPNLLVPPRSGAKISCDLYFGGSSGVESSLEKEQTSFVARIAGTKALGMLAVKLTRPPDPPGETTLGTTDGLQSREGGDAVAVLLGGLARLLASNYALHKMVSVLVIYHWRDCPARETLGHTLLSALTDTSGMEDMVPYILAMQRDCQSLIVAIERRGLEIAKDITPSGYTVNFATQLATTTYQDMINSPSLDTAALQELEMLHRNVVSSLGQLQEEQQRLATRISSCVAGTLISLRCLPEKLNPVIRPLMDCIKTEADSVMQELGASWLSQLVDLCRDRTPSPTSKIIKNLCQSACCDPLSTPGVMPPRPLESRRGVVASRGKMSKSVGSTAQIPVGSTSGEVENTDDDGWKWNSGIISLVRLRQDMREVMTSSKSLTRGRPSLKETAMANLLQEGQRKLVSCQRRGAEMALVQLCRHFKEELFHAVPYLWTCVHQPLNNLPELSPDLEKASEPSSNHVAQAQAVISSLRVLEIIAPVLAMHLIPQTLLPHLLPALYSPFTAVRHMAARGMASLAQLDLHYTMQFVVSEVLPLLGASSSLPHRQGAVEAVSCILEGTGLRALVYVVLLLMPLLGTMSDQDQHVRLMASRAFADLVTLMPLEVGTATPPEMSVSLAEKRETDRHFIEQLLDTRKLDSYVVPVPIRADLRKYQQDGINWLAFLNKYKLHGILCDDMGLGKTLQSLCLIAGDHHSRTKQYKATGQVDCKPLPSLVVCPPTLMGHWVYEVKKFCDTDDLFPFQYYGSPNMRARLQDQIPDHGLVIASYDIVRNDIDFFKTIHWNYCVLDEGHVIKNTKTKITRAIKQLQANHRLILSGTPIQNNVLELWSLFDFLMPGFLGSEKQFYERFGRPIILSRDAKSSSKEQAAGALAMESLHRQVLPFLLRRMKEDVLQDLPPKIIQDYYCDLSPLQVLLYEDFSKSHAKKKVAEDLVEGDGSDVGGEEMGGGKETRVTHIFQALQYLRKVCNHPALVVKRDHPLYNSVQDYLIMDCSHITDIKHASKLQALRQLLVDCGIGDPGDESDCAQCLSAVSQHRALIFCQYKSMLDIIENDLLKAHMSSVTYLRLDGSVASGSRFDVVNKFNSDPSVDVLLLTTHVGGLGLNLTGADTVIFFEHDWNPMRDLQAMDRAHRIGQKKVVNVYRLITKGTLEEKIMSLQKFKLNIANTVIGQDNSSLRSMNTSDLLDLFQVSSTTHHGNKQKGDLGRVGRDGVGDGREGMKKVLENLPELSDARQYTDEYDLTEFMKSLKKI